MAQDVEVQLQVWKDLAISKQILMGAATDALGLDAECSTEELKSALKLSDEQVRNIFLQSDLDGDGFISFPEFKHAMQASIDKKEMRKSHFFAGVDLKNRTGIAIETGEEPSPIPEEQEMM